MQTKSNSIWKQIRTKVLKKGSQKTIRSNLIFSQCCVLLALTILLGFSIYTFTCEVLKTRNRESYGKILSAAEVIMNDTLTYYEDVSRLILEKEVIQRELSRQHFVDESSIFMDNITVQMLDEELNVYANGYVVKLK